MRRRSFWVTLLILAVAVGVVAGVAGVMLAHEPEFYTTPETSGFETTERASKLVTRVQDLKNDIRQKPEWGTAFGAADLNGFFRENLAEGNGLTGLLPAGMHSPRVVIDGDRVRLGLRYGTGTFSTVVWVELKAWLVAEETNLIALELCGFYAGAVPLGCQSLLDAITELAHGSNIEVTWYRSGGNPVGLFRFYADQLRPTTQITTFRLENGTVTVAGRTRLDTSPGSAPPGVSPVGD